MPYSITKVGTKYRVLKDGRKVADHATRAKAEAQIRLLRGLEHGLKRRKR